MWRQGETVSIGIRELRNSLSSQLRTVSDGNSLTVTDHGRAIARIVPIDESSAFQRLLAAGLLQPPSTDDHGLPEPLTMDGTVSDLVGEQRV